MCGCRCAQRDSLVLFWTILTDVTVVLVQLLQMACAPFDPWGAEDDPTPQDCLDEEITEERRYCGIGEKQMLGFQCSCSS